MLTADTGCQCCQPRAEPYVIESNGWRCNTETNAPYASSCMVVAAVLFLY